ncbi:MAG TPA: hypothetical protein VGM39_18210 [Kofleriaceae bacterium]|jgi:hypothetical protein
MRSGIAFVAAGLAFPLMIVTASCPELVPDLERLGVAAALMLAAGSATKLLAGRVYDVVGPKAERTRWFAGRVPRAIVLRR